MNGRKTAEEKNINNFTIRNLSLLYQQGITCSSMGVEFSACYLPKNSTYGVNPNIICDEKEIWWMLAFLNSNLVKYTVRGILIRTNMVTSGYVARIPVSKFCEEEKLKLTILGKEAYETAKKDPKEIHQYINSINELIFNKLNLSNGVRDILNEFCANIVKRA